MKPVAILLLLVLLVPLFAGCHGSAGLDPFTMPEAFDTEKEYEITFWAKSDTNIRQTRVYEAAIRGFEECYPNVTVTLRLYTDYGRIYNDVITNIATGTTPNVCITYPDHIATYITGDNVVVPLDDLFTHEAYGLGGRELRFDSPTVDEIIPKFLEECEIDGVHYAMPYMRSTEACYINKTYVEKLGYTVPDVVTWDFIWEVSEAAMAQDDEGNYLINGQKVMIPFIYKSTDNMMIQMLRQLGAGYSTEEGEILVFHDTTKELLYTISQHAKTGAFSTFKISSYPANFLNAGQCIFAIDSTAGATWMGTDAPLSDISEESLVPFETAVRMVPQFDPANPQMISQGPSVCVFNKADEGEVMASWLFAQYLLTNDVQIGYAQTEGYVPVTTKAQEAPEYKAYMEAAGTDNDTYYSVKIEASRLLMESVDKSFVTPVFNGSASLRNAAGQLIENTVKSTRRKETIDDAYIDKLYHDIATLYRLDQGSVAEGKTVGKAELGPLPEMAKVLIGSLAGVWVLILGYFAWERIKKQRK